MMPRRRLKLGEFLIPLLILLPAAYFVWYVLGAWFLVPVVVLSDTLSQWLFPNTVQRVLQDGVFLLVVVADSSAASSALAPLDGPLPTPVDAFRVYGPPLGAGIPLFLALSVASDARPVRHLLNIISGMVLLLLGQSLSVMVKVTATLFSQVPDFRPSGEFCSADCYWAILFPVQYFTYLIVPSLLAVLVWAVLYAPYVRSLVPTLTNHMTRNPHKPRHHT